MINKGKEHLEMIFMSIEKLLPEILLKQNLNTTILG